MCWRPKTRQCWWRAERGWRGRRCGKEVMLQFMGVILAIESICVAVLTEKANIVCTVAYSLVLKIELHDVPIFLGSKTKRNPMTLYSHKKKKAIMVQAQSYIWNLMFSMRSLVILWEVRSFVVRSLVHLTQVLSWRTGKLESYVELTTASAINK